MRTVFSRVKTMSENGENGSNQTETVEALKAKIAELEAENTQLRDRITELEAENEKLRRTLEKGAAALESEIEEQKAAAIKAITEKTNFSKGELEKMKLPALRLILKTIDSAKGTVKNIRSASTGSSGDQSKLTVGALYHKE
jgi:predicted RNase H-like nuclease (RuvC/YqgF family)